MSYKKAMRHARNIRKAKKQRKMHFGFSLLSENQRRRTPWLGAWAQDPERAEEVDQYIKAYDAETERLKTENPNLVIVD